MHAIPEGLYQRCIHDEALYKSTFTFTFTFRGSKWSQITEDTIDPSYWSEINLLVQKTILKTLQHMVSALIPVLRS